MKYDTVLEKRQTPGQLRRRGLDKPGIDLVAIGIIDLVETHDIDTDLYTVTDTGTEEIKDGKAYVVYDKTPKTGSDIRGKIKDKIHERRDTILVSGISFSFDDATHILQTRDAVELVNWMSTYTAAQALPTDTTIKVRTEADKSLNVPAGQMVTLLTHMIEYRTAVMTASWTIKDAIDDAATDAEAFTAYESGIETAWPDDSPKQI